MQNKVDLLPVAPHKLLLATSALAQTGPSGGQVIISLQLTRQATSVQLALLNTASAAWRHQMMPPSLCSQWRRKPGVASYLAINSALLPQP
ncbi:hypothetical protein D3C81_1069970 [compost metagenome]